MKNINESFFEYCSKNEKTKFFLSSVYEKGEGELKIFKNIKDRNINEKSLVIGSDGDLLVLSIGSLRDVDVFLLNHNRDGGLLFNINQVKNHFESISENIGILNKIVFNIE